MVGVSVTNGTLGQLIYDIKGKMWISQNSLHPQEKRRVTEKEEVSGTKKLHVQ